MKSLVAIFAFLFAVSVQAEESCSLKIGDTARTLHNFGRIQLAEIAPTYIWLSPAAGNIVPGDPQGHSAATFNFNTLYRVSDAKGGAWYFRFAGVSFDAEKKRSLFWAVQWADRKYPVFPGDYQIESVEAPRPQAGQQTFATIGDSMTWFNDGQYFRCKLATKLSGYRFIGSNTDSFGFGHDGHGGDNSLEVLNRVDRVPVADAYFLLVGANDIGYTPKETAQRIAKIVGRLLDRGNNPRVYVSTLPVRGDKYAWQAPKRSAAIRDWYKSCDCHANVTLVDTRASMLNTKYPLANLINPKPDLIHPSPAGYDLMTDLISDSVKSSPGTKRASTAADSPRAATGPRPSAAP